MNILITGVAGFIGQAVALRLLQDGHKVCGIDNLNDYYAVSLKQARLHTLQDKANFKFLKLDITDRVGISDLFSGHQFDIAIHLAAQPGIRYSLQNPHAYVDTNVVGYTNILEACRHHNIEHFIYASSSSVYGENETIPYSETDRIDTPMSLYAATKQSNELFAYSYSSLFQLHCTGLRFFTVYGPWGRPDMAIFKFTKKIIDGTPIEIYNHGKMERDLTFIDDIVEGIVRVAEKKPDGNHHQVFNIGNNTPVKLNKIIETIENAVGKKAIKKLLPRQSGEMAITHADTSRFEKAYNFRPKTTLLDGIHSFVDWYKDWASAPAPK